MAIEHVDGSSALVIDELAVDPGKQARLVLELGVLAAAAGEREL